MTCGLGILLDLKHLVFILTLHCWLSVIFYRTHIHHAKISAFIKLMESLGTVEIARTGVCGMTRGNTIDLIDAD